MAEGKKKTSKSEAPTKAPKMADIPVFEGFEALTAQWQKTFSGSNDVMTFCKENLEAFVESMRVSSANMEKMSADAVAFQQKILEDASSMSLKALSAQSFQEMVELQSNYTKNVMEGYMTQMTRLGEMWSEGVQAATKPLTERACAMMQMVQGPRA